MVQWVIDWSTDGKMLVVFGDQKNSLLIAYDELASGLAGFPVDAVQYINILTYSLNCNMQVSIVEIWR